VLDTLLASARAEEPRARKGSDAADSARCAAAQVRDTLAVQGKSIAVACGDRRRRAAVEDDVVQRILAPLLDNAARFARRRVELESFRWLLGDWTYENPVPATRVSPAYCDVGVARYATTADGAWICLTGGDGRSAPLLTFDPWSQQWMYVLTNGAFGILRSPGWDGDRIVFIGTMTMLGVTCQWRMTWTRHGPEQFALVNEEQAVEGGWNYIDKWLYRRKQGI